MADWKKEEMKEIKIILICLIVAGLSGCCDSDFFEPKQPARCYYVNPDKKISSIGRVAIAELQNESLYPQVSVEMSETLYSQLQKKQVAGLSVVHKSDAVWKVLQLPPMPPYDLQQLSDIRKSLKCDALIIGTITEYKPYPHLAVGLRLKMIDLTDGQVVWGYEQVWDTADRTCQQRGEKYYRSEKNTDLGVLQRGLINASSIEFLKFVSFEVSQTL
jgi:hypothetical protein